MAFNSTLPPEFDAVRGGERFPGAERKIYAQHRVGQNGAGKNPESEKNTGRLPRAGVRTERRERSARKIVRLPRQIRIARFLGFLVRPLPRENPNLVKAYDAYKDKGFTILGISLDKPGDKDKWLEAIRKDGLRWTQVSDLKAWES